MPVVSGSISGGEGQFTLFFFLFVQNCHPFSGFELKKKKTFPGSKSKKRSRCRFLAVPRFEEEKMCEVFAVRYLKQYIY